MGYIDKLKAKRAEEKTLKHTLSSDQEALKKAQSEARELVPSVRGLKFNLEPGKQRKNQSFVTELMQSAGAITKSVQPNGAITPRFAMAVSANMEKDPYVILLCFNRGLEELEMRMVTTSAKLLALKHGLRLKEITEIGKEAEIAEVEASQNGRRIIGTFTFGDDTTQLIDVVVNPLFRQFSSKSVLFIMMCVGVGQAQGHSPADIVKSFFELGTEQVEILARQVGESLQVNSDEKVTPNDLKQLIPGTNSFVVQARLI